VGQGLETHAIIAQDAAFQNYLEFRIRPLACQSLRKKELFLAECIFPERHEPLIKSYRRALIEKSIREAYEYERLYPIVEELAKKKGIATDRDMFELFDEACRLTGHLRRRYTLSTSSNET
jgi:hypothetical protein